MGAQEQKRAVRHRGQGTFLSTLVSGRSGECVREGREQYEERPDLLLGNFVRDDQGLGGGGR